jgi:hypothetical protein
MTTSIQPARRKTDQLPQDEADRRRAVFCSALGPTVFRAVAHPTEVWTPDPFDVETIHEDARDVFVRALDRATMSGDDPGKTGQILLLEGESGSGKTHLMRAFRTHTHRRGLGYFGYMQMTSACSNYYRYMLHKLIDSLDQPYYRSIDNPGETTGLMRLSEAVTESPRISQSELKLLRDEDQLSQRERNGLVEDLADELLTDPRFAGDEKLLDLLRSMLLLQCGHPGVRARVMKYLRGELLSESDRERIGGITPLDPENGPEDLLHRLGRLMWSTHGMGLVVCVDQLEDMYRADQSEEAANRFRRAVQGLVSIAAHVPTAVVVIACLEDYYVQLSSLLDRSHLDRIEKDAPKPVTLVAKRNRDEVTQLIAAHLRHLYEETDTPFDEADPTTPIPAKCLDEQAGQRTRDVLEWAHSYRDACIAAGEVVADCRREPGGKVPPRPDVTELEQLWNDFLAGDLPAAPEDEAELSRVLEDAVHFYEDELPRKPEFHTDRNGRLLSIAWADSGQSPRRLLAGICNKKAQGGGLGLQVSEVSETAREQVPAAVPVIVRSADYPSSPQAKVTKQLGKLIAGGGRKVVVHDTEWRTMLAMRLFRAEHKSNPRFFDWLAEFQPLSDLQSLRDIFGPDRHGFLEETVSNPKDDGSGGADANSPDADQSAASSSKTTPSEQQETLPYQEEEPPVNQDLEIGRIRSRSAEAATISPQKLRYHSAFLGSTGSGKTTAALNLIEQLLLQGVPALLIDRKGDLARYAADAAWNEPPADASLADRQAALRRAVDVALYTPGHGEGRPVVLPVVPEQMQEMSAADRTATARQAAHSLGGMMGYGATGQNASRIAIMMKAIELLAEDDRVTLQTLIDYIHEQDPVLINAIGALDPRLFNRLVQDLQTLKINRANLFPQHGDPLDADALFGLGQYARQGKTRLSIISTKFLGSKEEVQFWVAQLLMELSRWMSKNPSDKLQAVVLFDEADLYLPATSKPATKEPMENLLKRARSAGLGLMLATQSPGDFDYKCRENINTWLIGKIKEEPAIKKMKPMLHECRTDVSGKLPDQGIGQFFLIQDGAVSSVQSGRSAIETEQVPEDEILELARLQKSH